MRQMKLLFLLMSVGVMLITCNKQESSTSSSIETDTVEAAGNDSTKSEQDSMAVTFDRISEDEYNTMISDYDKNFSGTSLSRKNFEIDKDSFNSTIASFEGKKKNLDIYFVLYENGENGLIFKFTDKNTSEPDYLLSAGEHQYMIKDKKLTLADDLNLRNLVDNFNEKYKDHFRLLKDHLHTISIRDVVNTIPVTENNIILKPCLNKDYQVSLATQINGLYYNRGALWP